MLAVNYCGSVIAVIESFYFNLYEEYNQTSQIVSQHFKSYCFIGHYDIHCRITTLWFTINDKQLYISCLQVY